MRVGCLGRWPLLLPALAAAHTSSVCEEWCTNPCDILNGNVEQECGSCTGAQYLCQRGATGFSWRERQKIVQPLDAKRGAPTSSAPAPTVPLDAFDEQHGCRLRQDYQEGGQDDACEDWDLDELPAQLDQGRAYCRHALCLGRMLAANGAPVEAGHFARAPTHFMAHEYFPLRLGGAELFVALCSQLVRALVTCADRALISRHRATHTQSMLNCVYTLRLVAQLLSRASGRAHRPQRTCSRALAASPVRRTRQRATTLHGAGWASKP